MSSLSKTKKLLTERIEFVKATKPDNTQAQISANYEIVNSENADNDSLIVLKPKKHSSGNKTQVIDQNQNSFDGDAENYLTPPAKVLYPREKLTELLKWKKPEEPGAGLENQGHTCFMDAALQCLYYTPPFANFVSTSSHRKNCLIFFYLFQPFPSSFSK